MFESVSATLSQCFSFFILGIVFGFLYELFRFLRLLKRHNTIAVAIEDVLYMSVFAFVSFTMSLMIGSGYFRLYYCFCEVAGLTLYYFTLGKLLHFLMRKSIGAIKSILKRMFRFIGRRLKKLIVFFKQKSKPLFVIYNKMLKKIITKRRKLLQNKSTLLYNNSIQKNEGSENKNAVKGHIRKKA